MPNYCSSVKHFDLKKKKKVNNGQKNVRNQLNALLNYNIFYGRIFFFSYSFNFYDLKKKN